MSTADKSPQAYGRSGSPEMKSYLRARGFTFMRIYGQRRFSASAGGAWPLKRGSILWQSRIRQRMLGEFDGLTLHHPWKYTFIEENWITSFNHDSSPSAPPRIPNSLVPEAQSGIFFRAKLYFLVVKNCLFVEVLCFDVAKEKFSRNPGPAQLKRVDVDLLHMVLFEDNEDNEALIKANTSIDFYAPTIDGPQKLAILEEEEFAEAEASWAIGASHMPEGNSTKTIELPTSMATSKTTSLHQVVSLTQASSPKETTPPKSYSPTMEDSSKATVPTLTAPSKPLTPSSVALSQSPTLEEQADVEVFPPPFMFVSPQNEAVKDISIQVLLHPEQCTVAPTIEVTKAKQKRNKKSVANIPAQASQAGSKQKEIYQTLGAGRCLLKKNMEMKMGNEEVAMLTDWAYDCFREGRLDALVNDDEELTSDLQRIERVLKVAIWCIQEDPMLRRPMKKVRQMLEGAIEVAVPPDPSSYISSMQ
ncbi:G-type lectin S-receptor-like serine/threonine-protein kinase RLK1 [Acorus calamus]|uniref:G-type lectin S-receptor-like serine/threonine-protein kinase RLK1 n=1 Tax=Acorus calamus TaxID=4465 RepID=A0AAV9EMS2_ACOCL|nr:G-type lectin S-receptor-like serine/threonine-protein kinase RLK1 [Acorus calamus]